MFLNEIKLFSFWKKVTTQGILMNNITYAECQYRLKEFTSAQYQQQRTLKCQVTPLKLTYFVI